MPTDAALKMTKARIALITGHPFFGVLALRLKLIEDASIKPPTMRTNGKYIKYHPDFVKKCTHAEVEGVIAHEVGHCIFDHVGRRNGRQPRRWNFAGDYVINDMLLEIGMSLPASRLHSPQFKGMSTDAVYSLLPPDDGNDSSDDFDGVDDADPAEVEALEHEWKIATTQAAAAAKGSGNLPGALKRFVDEMLSDATDWRERLHRFATQRAAEDYSYTRVNRRFASLGIYLPGLYSEATGTMVVVSDDSGSISNNVLAMFAGETAAARAAANPEETIVISCDAAVNHVDRLDRFQPLKMESHGGGGTDFRPPFDWLEEQGITPACLIYLTDGYGPFPETSPDYPVLWCMTTDVVPPWGERVQLPAEV